MNHLLSLLCARHWLFESKQNKIPILGLTKLFSFCGYESPVGESHIEFRMPPLLPRDSYQASGFWACSLNKPLGGREQSRNTAVGNPCVVEDTHTHTYIHMHTHLSQCQRPRKCFLMGKISSSGEIPYLAPPGFPGPLPHSVKVFLSPAVKPT